ncbi:hypothetical protein [Kordiimonas sp.]|uniref:hypothetical protein n=1 Tax=Kordiimonas sp. TaxID=1970157 RepID=UPI003A8F8D8C
MSFNEKMVLGVLGATIVVFGWYFMNAFAMMQAGATSVGEFGPAMWVMIGVYVAALIATTVISAIMSRNEGEEMGEVDERDEIIEARSERVGSYVQATGLFGILVLVMFEYSTFTIAHAILALMALSTIISFSIRLYLYRKGA